MTLDPTQLTKLIMLISEAASINQIARALGYTKTIAAEALTPLKAQGGLESGSGRRQRRHAGRGHTGPLPVAMSTNSGWSRSEAQGC